MSKPATRGSLKVVGARPSENAPGPPHGWNETWVTGRQACFHLAHLQGWRALGESAAPRTGLHLVGAGRGHRATFVCAGVPRLGAFARAGQPGGLELRGDPTLSFH
jgi:hypothetical protein